ncbi:hypothetical protein ACQ4PT_046052 [Festuca glaucescens]
MGPVAARPAYSCPLRFLSRIGAARRRRPSSSADRVLQQRRVRHGGGRTPMERLAAARSEHFGCSGRSPGFPVYPLRTRAVVGEGLRPRRPGLGARTGRVPAQFQSLGRRGEYVFCDGGRFLGASEAALRPRPRVGGRPGFCLRLPRTGEADGGNRGAVLLARRLPRPFCALRLLREHVQATASSSGGAGRSVGGERRAIHLGGERGRRRAAGGAGGEGSRQRTRRARLGAADGDPAACRGGGVRDALRLELDAGGRRGGGDAGHMADEG